MAVAKLQSMAKSVSLVDHLTGGLSLLLLTHWAGRRGPSNCRRCGDVYFGPTVAASMRGCRAWELVPEHGYERSRPLQIQSEECLPPECLSDVAETNVKSIHLPLSIAG